MIPRAAQNRPEPQPWEAIWSYLAVELQTSLSVLRADGIHLADEAPLPRPYFQPPEGLLAAFHRGESLTIAAAAGFVGFARSWIHHYPEASTATSPAGLRWLRQNLGRGGARLQVFEQYALVADDLPARRDPRVRRLVSGDEPLLIAELGWSPAEATEWVARGIYAAFVGGRLACRVCTYRLHDHLAEVGVATREEFRGQGLATAAVQVASLDLLRDHHAVLYSCDPENVASVAVARRLGAHDLGDMVYALDEHQTVAP
ncbi:MAG: GNAT family N-acetyltransferase [Armatimonadetes bacterium]|nr:GNAT family N-acetyltransferase [Armatimonadota bacterium]